MTPEEARKHRAILSPEQHMYWCLECNQNHYDAHGDSNPKRTGISEKELLAACYPKKIAVPPSQPGYYFVKIADCNGVGAMWDEYWVIGEYSGSNDIDICGSDCGIGFGETKYSVYRIVEVGDPIELPKD